MSPERYAFITELFPDGTDGVTTLDFEVEVADAEKLEEQAALAWLGLVRRAGLPERAPAFVGFLPPSYEARYDVLRQDADGLIAEGHYDLAVLRLQTALEVLSKLAIAGGLRGAVGRRKGDALMRLTTSAMTDRTTGPLLDSLVGHRPDRTAWWSDYRTHLTRRNQIAHAGKQVTGAEALASCEVVDHAMAWLKDLWSGRLAEPD